MIMSINRQINMFINLLFLLIITFSLPCYATTLSGTVQENSVVTPLQTQQAAEDNYSAPPLAPPIVRKEYISAPAQVYRPMPLPTPTKEASINVGIPQFGAMTPKEQHGKAILGVLGIQLDFKTGVLLAVFPPSDLRNYSIHPGDKIISYMGRPFTKGEIFQRDVAGEPGTPVDITLMHDGRIITIYPNRVDSRLLVHYDLKADHYFSECAALSRYW